jgi:hypothetical protein
MATLTIPDSTYHRLQEIAAARSVPLEQFLDQVAGAAIGNSLPSAKSGTSEWMAAFDAWVADHAARATVADDSRDAIYGDECE